MKACFPLLFLSICAFSARAQAVRYSSRGHLPIESQPAPGHERPEYLGMGDSVFVLNSGLPAVAPAVSARMRGLYVYVRYPAYRDQPAGRGWVMRQGLVGTLDSLNLDLPPVVGQTRVTTKTVSTRRYVPAPAASQPIPGIAKRQTQIKTGLSLTKQSRRARARRIATQ